MAQQIEKTPEAWKRIYREKLKVMEERGFPEVTPKEFYRDVFPAGSLQRKGHEEDPKGNIILTKIRGKGRRNWQYVITDELDGLKEAIGDPFGLIPPISFYGRTHTKRNAHELYAVAIDIDYVGIHQLKNLLKQFGNGVQLCPTYLVSSGKGLHLYYLLQEPIPLYHNLEVMLRDIKEAFIRRLWNDTSSLAPDKPDLTGIYQGFRCVGSLSKLGKGYPVRAYRLCDRRYTLEDIKASIPSCKVDVSLDRPYVRPKGVIPLAKAKELYPEWYQERIVEKQPKFRNRWVCKRDLYEWWKRRIMDDVKEGGRYFSIMALCAYGIKCGIPRKEIRADAYEFLDLLDSRTEQQDNHFTRADVDAALRALRKDREKVMVCSSRAWIEKHTKVDIPPNKRNGRTQAAHMMYARGIRKLRMDMGEADLSGGGRPNKAELVAAWRRDHPDGTKAECNRATGIDPKTIRKWWQEGAEA